jgi:hypothetical protein
MLPLLVLLYFVIGFFFLRYNYNFGGWISMIAHFHSKLAILLYVLSLLLWPIFIIFAARW